jgi:phosphate transport system protein
MSKHLQADLDRVRKQLLEMGSMVESAIQRAIASLVDRRPELADEVLLGDDAIDQKELEIEDACLKILALHQPVASDLRYVVAVMKVNNDLERMGDLAQNIAERAAYLSTHDPLDVELPFLQMTQSVQGMVSSALDALVKSDTRLARRVCRQDDEIDAQNREMYVVLQDVMKRDPRSVERAVHTLSVARHLERIADQATNIAEDVVFMVEGEVIRHHVQQPGSEPRGRDLPPIRR